MFCVPIMVFAILLLVISAAFILSYKNMECLLIFCRRYFFLIKTSNVVWNKNIKKISKFVLAESWGKLPLCKDT